MVTNQGLAGTSGLAGINEVIGFYREDIDESECVISECANAPKMVHLNDPDDVICKPHYREMTPRERRNYVPTSYVAYKNPKVSVAETMFSQDDAADEEEFELTDAEADAALVEPSEG